MAKCAIGIDLGTSNCALEWCDLSDETGSVSTFKVRQYETNERVVELDVLPSFLYLPKDDESDRPFYVGILARGKTQEQPGRCIHSAKSWLCHTGVDREASILPWQSVDLPPAQKKSPVAASAAYLSYLKRSWDAHFKDKGEAYTFDRQQVTVTVPASFDQVAQRLTMKAAEKAGFPSSMRLLEEPQAAFLSWIQESENRLKLEELQTRNGNQALSVVVCDVGGGTTDFSLFSVLISEGVRDPQVERIAVSDHILLGGDNIDIALAKKAEAEFAFEGYTIEPEQWLQLIAQARAAKEEALGLSKVGEILRITLMDTGSNLFAGTRSLEWNREEIADWIVGQFFPECESAAEANRDFGGFVELSLPYSQEAAVTVHLAEFLKGRQVDAILFNGGTVSALRIQERICSVVANWQRAEFAPALFASDSPYLAVARGAAYYGQRLKAQADTLIRAGASRPFLVEVQASEKTDERHLLCLLPKGATPADSITIKKPTFALRLDRPVQFQPYSGPDTDRIRQGQIVKWKADQYRPMPPLQTLALSGEKPQLGKTNVTEEITLFAQMNELGLVEVSCHSINKRKKKGKTRWDLSFDLRQVLGSENQLAESSAKSVEIEEMRTHFREVFEKSFGERLLKDLEERTDRKRSKWPLPVLRSGFDVLIDQVSRRSQSETYETAWWMAAGYCLRPGFGAPLDEFRIQQIDALFDLGLGYTHSKSVAEQNAIFWRRVAGGLSSEFQERIFESMKALALSGTKKGLEPLKALAAFEKLNLKSKRELTQFLEASLINTPRWALESYLWCLGRVCARIPLSASQENILPASEVSTLLIRVLDKLPSTVPESQLRLCMLQSARISGSRDLDISERDRDQIKSALIERGIDSNDLKPLGTFTPVAKSDQHSQFGETLPQGLVLI